MQLAFRPHPLRLRHTFTVAGCSRSATPDVLVTLRHGGLTGYGEASMPPYLGETEASVCAFLRRVDLSAFAAPTSLDDVAAIMDYVDGLDADGGLNGGRNAAAKAAVDIALHDWLGRAVGQPVRRLLGMADAAPIVGTLRPSGATLPTTFTIGIDTPDVVRAKVLEATSGPIRFRRLKVKVGVPGDRDLIRAIRSVTDLPLTVDANQGWTDRAEALDEIGWLAAQGVVMVEQPLPKHRLDDAAWLAERSPLPVVADESCQGPADVARLAGAFHGINIKLMKCGGLRQACRMVAEARRRGMQVMLGCMTETTCAVSAAAQLAAAADWADLDGNLLIADDPFRAPATVTPDGLVAQSDAPGLGLEEKT